MSKVHTQTDTQRIPVYLCLSNAGTVLNGGNYSFQIPSLKFKPDYCSIAQFNIINSISNNNMYVLNSNINNEALLVFNGFTNTYYSSNTPFRVYNPLNNVINFNVQQVGTDGNPTTVVMTGTWYLGMILEFSKTIKFIEQ